MSYLQLCQTVVVKIWGEGGGVIHILPQKLKNTLMNYRIANHLAIENGRYY